MDTITLTILRLSAQGFLELCQANQDLQLERTATGEVIIMPPTFPWTGKQNSGLNAQLWNWNDQGDLLTYKVKTQHSKHEYHKEVSAVKDFQLQGINHIALVSKDMARTVDFYTNTLGLTLIKTIALPDGGQHFFFDIGNGDALAFFWFPQAPNAAPGIASVKPEALQTGDIRTAHGSMNHVAFNIPLAKVEEYREKLVAKGVQVTPLLHHADVPSGYVPEADESTFISSFYFFDPDGILLEFAANVRELGDPVRDIQHEPIAVGGTD